MVPIICVLNHERISWVSIEIYYHDNFVFGHIFMFMTSLYAHFVFFVLYVNYGMLLICWRTLRCCTSPYAGSRGHFGLAHEASQN